MVLIIYLKNLQQITERCLKLLSQCLLTQELCHLKFCNTFKQRGKVLTKNSCKPRSIHPNFGVRSCSFSQGSERDVSCLREPVCLWVHFCCHPASPCTAAQACPSGDSLGGRSLSSQSVLPRAINY